MSGGASGHSPRPFGLFREHIPASYVQYVLVDLPGRVSLFADTSHVFFAGR